jgi:bacillolysin
MPFFKLSAISTAILLSLSACDAENKADDQDVNFKEVLNETLSNNDTNQPTKVDASLVEQFLSVAPIDIGALSKSTVKNEISRNRAHIQFKDKSSIMVTNEADIINYLQNKIFPASDKLSTAFGTPSLKLKQDGKHKDEQGNTYYKFEQTFEGIPIFTKEIVVQVDANNYIDTISGDYALYLDIKNTDANLTYPQAVEALKQEQKLAILTDADNFLADTSGRLGVFDKRMIANSQRETKKPENLMDFVGLLQSSKGYALAYETYIAYRDEDNNERFEKVYLDANTGKLLDHRSVNSDFNIQLSNLNGSCGSNGSPSGSSDGGQCNPWYGCQQQNQSGDSGQDHETFNIVKNVGNFLQTEFNRDSYDNRGAAIKVEVQSTFPGQNGGSCNGLNAYFDGQQTIKFGTGGDIRDRNGNTVAKLNPLHKAIEIVGHEFFHAVTSKTGNMEYNGESGALNESVSDIFGSAFQAWIETADFDLEQNPDASFNPDEIKIDPKKTWIIGENINDGFNFTNNNSPSDNNYVFIRNMAQPSDDGQSPDDYSNVYTGSEDNGGVHSNSGIPNRSFALLAGGSNDEITPSSISVEGIGIRKASKAWYDALNNKFSSNTDFKEARNMVAQSAAKLYGGECSQEWVSTQRAFDAVKIPGTWELPESCDKKIDDNGKLVALVDTTPIDNTPVDNTPVDNTPVDNSPVDNTPVDNSPVDNTPVDNSPVDNTPVDNSPTGSTITDPIKQGTIIASSTFSNRYRIQNLQNSDTTDFWSSDTLWWGPFQKETLTFILPSQYTISKLSIDWKSESQLYSIYAKVDNEWVNAGYYFQNEAYKADINMANITTDQIMLVMIGGSFSDFFRISEVSLTTN